MNAVSIAENSPNGFGFDMHLQGECFIVSRALLHNRLQVVLR
jgi:hypothetical protein